MTARVKLISFPQDRFVKEEGLKNVLSLGIASQLPGCVGQWDHPKCPYKGSLDKSTLIKDPVDPEYNLHWCAIDASPEDVSVEVERTPFDKSHTHGKFAGNYRVKVRVDIRALEVGFMYRRYHFKPTTLEVGCQFKIDQFFLPGSRINPGSIENTSAKFSNKLKLTKVVKLNDPFSCCVRLAKPVVDCVTAPIVEGKITTILEEQVNEALKSVELEQWLTIEQFARASEAVVDTTVKIVEFSKILFGKNEDDRKESDESCTIS